MTLYNLAGRTTNIHLMQTRKGIRYGACSAWELRSRPWPALALVTSAQAGAPMCFQSAHNSTVSL